MLFNLIKLPPSAHFVRIHLPLGGRLFGTATSKAPSLRGLSPSGDWGSYPKYSCISAFFNSSSFSRLCCMVCFCWSTRSTKAANIRWFSNSGMRTLICNGVQREHNKKLNNGLPILHKVPPKRDYGRYFCIMAEKGGTSHGGLTEKLSLFFHAKKQEVNAYGR